MWNKGVGNEVLVIGGGGCLMGLVGIVHRIVATHDHTYFCRLATPTKLGWGSSVCPVSCIEGDTLEGD